MVDGEEENDIAFLQERNRVLYERREWQVQPYEMQVIIDLQFHFICLIIGM